LYFPVPSSSKTPELLGKQIEDATHLQVPFYKLGIHLMFQHDDLPEYFSKEEYRATPSK
jgi:hypothetical protein